MKTTLNISDNKLIFHRGQKVYEIALNTTNMLEKRANDYKFTGSIISYDYDHRNNLKSNEKMINELIIERSFLDKDLINQLNHSNISVKKDHTIKNLSILYIPLFILVVIFIVINILTR